MRTSGIVNFLRITIVGLLAVLGQVILHATAGTALLSLSPVMAHAQGVAGCENPPVDEPDGDGDECYVPPDPGKNLGPLSTDTNGSCDQAGQCAGDPINPTTGNAYEVLTDYLGRGPFPLVLTRYYNSQSLAVGSMGSNWTHSYSAHIVQLSPTVVLVVKGSQKILTFTLSGGTWTSGPDVNARLVKTASGWVYTTGEDNVETYDATGKLLSIATRAGQIQMLAYDNQGRLSTVTDLYGRTLTFSYDTSNRVVNVKNPAGRTYSYTYDANNNLVSFTGPDGKTQTYLYENISFPHALTGVIDENGVRYVTLTYDANGLAISSQLAGGVAKTSLLYDFINGSTTVTDALNHSTRYDYLTSGGMEHTLHVNEPLPGGSTAQNSWFYDDNGNISTYVDFLGNTTQYTSDLTRNLETQRVLPDGRIVNTTWHPVFRLPVLIQTVTQTEQRTYDSQGNLLQRTLTDTSRNTSRIWSFTYNSVGQILTATDPNQHVTNITYDKQGNTASITDASGHVATFSHDIEGRLTAIVDPNGLVTKFTYDVRGRIVEKLVGLEKYAYGYDPVGNTTSLSLPSGYKATLTYDGAHRLTGIVDSFSNSIQFALDAMSNRIKETHFDSTSSQVYTHAWTYDVLNRVAQSIGASNQTTNYSYDANSNLTELMDPLGNPTQFSYDALSRNFQTIFADGGIRSNAYDPLGHLFGITDQRSLVTTYTVDALGNTLTTVNPDQGTTTMVPDAGGNIVSRTDAKGQNLLYHYDSANRVIQIVRGDTEEVLNTYTYDQADDVHLNGIGHLTSMKNASGKTDWSYDRNGRIVKKVQTTSRHRFETRYSYDPASGNLVTMTLPSGKVVHYTTSNGLFSSLSLKDNNRLLPLVSNIQYEPFSGPKSWVLGNSEIELRSFDQDGRITADGADSLITYDAASRISGVTLKGATVGSHSYSYDSVGRLTALGGVESQTFTYDVSGNRSHQTVDSQAVDFMIDHATNRLLGSTGATAVAYSYDANGSRIQDGTNSYTYDVLRRVVKVSSKAGVTTYSYNGLGERVRKHFQRSGGRDGDEDNDDDDSKQNTTIFVYDEAGHLVGEYDRSGAAIEETIYLGDMVVAVLKGDHVFFVHSDYRNAPRQIDNRGQEPVWTWDPLDFGNADPQNPDADDERRFTYNLRFPGQIFDAESGNHYNYFRNYDPAVGRYLESDPLDLRAGTNTYLYVRGNPISLTDRFGLCPNPISSFISFLISHPDLLVQVILTEAFLGGPEDPAADAAALAEVANAKRAANVVEATAGGIGPVLQGQQGVAQAIAEIESEGGTILGREITVDAGGVRARPDLLVQNADGSINFVEVKTGGGQLTPNQQVVYPLIEQGGAVPAGANAANAGLQPGVPLPPTPVRIIRYP